MLRLTTALFLLGLMTGIAPAQDDPAPRKEPAPKTEAKKGEAPFKTDKEKVSYAFGLNIGRNIVSTFEQDGFEIDYDILAKGLIDALQKKDPQLSDEEIRAAMIAFQKEMRAKQEEVQAKQAAERKQLAEKNKKEADEFLAKNKKQKGVKTTKSGLQYTVIKEGTGAKPKETDTVKTHYEGKLLDGTVFDSSYKRKEPATFPLNGVIKGWTEALQLMRVGSKYRLYVPAELAYGANPRPGSPIGPNAMLIFEVELLEIVE